MKAKLIGMSILCVYSMMITMLYLSNQIQMDHGQKLYKVNAEYIHHYKLNNLRNAAMLYYGQDMVTPENQNKYRKNNDDWDISEMVRSNNTNILINGKQMINSSKNNVQSGETSFYQSNDIGSDYYGDEKDIYDNIHGNDSNIQQIDKHKNQSPADADYVDDETMEFKPELETIKKLIGHSSSGMKSKVNFRKKHLEKGVLEKVFHYYEYTNDVDNSNEGVSSLMEELIQLKVFNISSDASGSLSLNQDTLMGPNVNTSKLNQVKDLLEKIVKEKTKRLYSEFTFKFVITPSGEVCAEGTAVVVFVVSAIRNWDRRSAIRGTWGSAIEKLQWPDGETVKRNVSLVFVTALDLDIKWDTLLIKESEVFGDIITVNYIDSYRNLTLKSLSLLKYAAEYCGNVPYIVKSDDDVLLDVPQLLQVLFEEKLLPSWSLMGLCAKGKPILRRGIWNVPHASLPFKNYPTYLSGSLYILTSDIVESLYIKSHFVPLIEIEDAYVTGLLGAIVEANHVCLNSLFTYSGDEIPSYCDVAERRKIAYSGFNALQLVNVWHDFYKYWRNCTSSKH